MTIRDSGRSTQYRWVCRAQASARVRLEPASAGDVSRRLKRLGRPVCEVPLCQLVRAVKAVAEVDACAPLHRAASAAAGLCTSECMRAEDRASWERAHCQLRGAWLSSWLQPRICTLQPPVLDPLPHVGVRISPCFSTRCACPCSLFLPDACVCFRCQCCHFSAPTGDLSRVHHTSFCCQDRGTTQTAVLPLLSRDAGALSTSTAQMMPMRGCFLSGVRHAFHARAQSSPHLHGWKIQNITAALARHTIPSHSIKCSYITSPRLQHRHLPPPRAPAAAARAPPCPASLLPLCTQARAAARRWQTRRPCGSLQGRARERGP